MTTEGLENLKAVLRKAIELQVNATLVMATLQSIYCDEEDVLEEGVEGYLRPAMTFAGRSLDFAREAMDSIRKAYDIEKYAANQACKLDNKQDNE